MTRARSLAAALSWTVAAAAAVLLVGSWLVMTRAARQALFFEPTTEALARAAEGRTDGVAAALVLAAAALLLALAARRSWLVLLALPGLVTGLVLAVAPRAAALVFDVLATGVTLPLVVGIAVARGVRRRRAGREGP